MRSFLIRASPVRGVTEFPVRIVAVKNARQYDPYRINAFAAAFYTKGRYRDYIVLGDLDPDRLPIAIHEYMHLVVENSGIKLPVWLIEGWADVYSTLKPIGKKSMVGDLIPGRVRVLLQQKWLPFETLTSVSHDSPAYNEKDRASIFYAESWALTHLLYLSPEYSGNFNKFLLALNSGRKNRRRVPNRLRQGPARRCLPTFNSTCAVDARITKPDPDPRHFRIRPKPRHHHPFAATFLAASAQPLRTGRYCLREVTCPGSIGTSARTGLFRSRMLMSIAFILITTDPCPPIKTHFSYAASKRTVLLPSVSLGRTQRPFLPSHSNLPAP